VTHRRGRSAILAAVDFPWRCATACRNLKMRAAVKATPRHAKSILHVFVVCRGFFRSCVGKFPDRLWTYSGTDTEGIWSEKKKRPFPVAYPRADPCGRGVSMSKTYLTTVFSVVCLVLVATTAFAQNPVGTYKYAEKGYSGTMTISRMGPGFAFAFKTKDTRSGQMCDFKTVETPIEEGGGRVDDALPGHGGTKDDGIKFTISFSGKNATVQVDSKGDECGMSGYFGGKYVKTK